MSHEELVEKVKTSLELDEQLPQQIKGWKVQSVGLIFIFAVLFCAALGVFGDGLLSQKKINHGQITIEYERFHRHGAQMQLSVEATNSNNEDVVISFPTSYLQWFNVESIVPEPATNKAQNGYVNYVFEGTGPMHITFHFIPETAGQTESMLRVNEEEFTVSHFIYP